MNAGIPVTLERGGKVISIFATMQDAAKSLGMHVSTIQWRVERGRDVKGERIRLATEAEKRKLRESKLKELIEKRRIKERSSTKKDTYVKESEFELDGVKLDGEKYRIVNYEITPWRLCITPCPFKESPKPMVGSAACATCCSFHGRDLVRRQVACSDVYARERTRRKNSLT